MSKKLNRLLYSIREELKTTLSISFGVFLFVQFFEPFPFEHFDVNNRLIFIAGLGSIIFLIMTLVRALFNILIEEKQVWHHEWILPSFLQSLFILSLSAVAWAFYLRYVGMVGITFHLMIKVIIICLAPPIVLRVNDLVAYLKMQNTLLANRNRDARQKEHIENNIPDKSINFISEYSSENIELRAADVIFLKSADNYVEIVYKDGSQFKKHLIRNTLKNIDQQLRQYAGFIRCHRICIINTQYINKLNKNLSSYWLTLVGYEDTIPVSRQYLLKVKETMPHQKSPV